MTHAEERRLYLQDRSGWARYVAPNWVRMLDEGTPKQRRHLWRIAPRELRVAITEVKRNGQLAV